MRKTIPVLCSGCSEEFQKRKSEVVRAVKFGLFNHFCSSSCQAIHANNSPGNVANLRLGSEPDDLSPFRFYLKTVRARHKLHNFDPTDLTLEYLKQVWEEQKGVCPLTGWKLDMPPTLTAWNGRRLQRDTASLDRVRPGAPYAQGNVRFIAHIANMAKHTYSDQDVIEFCKAVSENENKVGRVEAICTSGSE